MEGITTVDGVDQFCARLYEGDKAMTGVFTSAGWAGCVRELGLSLLMRVIMESASVQSVVFACRALSECVDTVLKEEGILSLEKIARLVCERLCVVESSVSPHAATRGAMARLVAAVIRCGYRHSADVANLPEELLKQGRALLQGEPGQTGGATNHTATGAPLCAICDVLSATVTTVGETDPISMTAKATGAMSTASRFRDEHLLEVYQFASLVIRRVGHCPALNSALQLLLNLMNYNITCALRSAEDEDNSWVCAEFPTRWQSAVVDFALFQRLWVLHQSSHANEVALKTLLEILARYVGIKSRQFPNPAERGKWVETTLLQTHTIMEQHRHLQSDEVRALFAVLLNRIKPACTVDELTGAPSFSLWCASCLRFTQLCLAECRLSDSCVLSLLSMWSAVGGSLSYATTAVEGLPDVLVCIVPAYLKAVSDSVAAFVSELSPCGGASVDGDYILEDDPEGAQLQLQFIASLAASSGKDGCRALHNFAQKVFEQAPAAIVGAGQDPVAAVTAAELASWLLRLAAASLSESAVSCDAETTEVVVFFAVLFLHRWTHEPDALQHLPEVVRDHLENAATCLCEAVGKTLLVPAYASSRQISKGVVQRLVAAQVLASDDHFTHMWFDTVLERCWRTLWAPNTSPAVRTAGLQYVCQLASGSSALRAIKSTNAFHRFVDLTPGHAPPLGPQGQWHRIRFLYARCVGLLRLSDSVVVGTSDDWGNGQLPQPAALSLRQLAQPVLVVWNSIDASGNAAASGSLPDEATLLASLCDARGLLFSAPRRAFVGLVELFHGHIPRLAERTLTPSQCHRPISVQMLKLVAEMTLNRSQRAFFGNHSALGFTLVRYAQQVVQAASTLLSVAAEEAAAAHGTAPLGDSSAWLWKTLRVTLDIGRNVFRGGYCNWAALTLFDGPSVVHFLDTMWPLVCHVGLTDGAQHPKVLLSLLHLVNEWLIPFFAPFWESRPVAEVQYVISFVEAVAFPTVPVQDATKTYALGVLQRFVELCAAPHAMTLSTEEELAQAVCLRRLLVSLDPERLHRVVTCCIELTLTTHSTLSTPLGGLLRAALLAEGEQLAVVANYFSVRCPTPQSADAFMQICRTVAERAAAADAEGVKRAAEHMVDHLRACL